MTDLENLARMILGHASPKEEPPEDPNLRALQYIVMCTSVDEIASLIYDLIYGTDIERHHATVEFHEKIKEHLK